MHLYLCFDLSKKKNSHSYFSLDFSQHNKTFPQTNDNLTRGIIGCDCFRVSFRFLVKSIEKNKLQKDGTRENYNNNREEVIKAVPQRRQHGDNENKNHHFILSILFGTPTLNFFFWLCEVEKGEGKVSE